MTKKKIPPTALQTIQKGADPSWMLASMLKDDDICGKIVEMEHTGWKVFQLIPTGSYFSILFHKE